jgi:hypothetical protein
MEVVVMGGGCFGMWDLTMKKTQKTDVSNPDWDLSTQKGRDLI